MSSRSSAPLRPLAAASSPRPEGAERRSYPRYALDLPGRFMRADKLDYPCRLRDISVAGAAMTTPAILTVGERVIVYLIHLGGLEGTVVRRFEGGFAMSITATQRKRDKLAAQILRLSKQQVIPESEERDHPRVPVDEVYTLVLADGTVLDCPVLDVSRSGVSLVVPVRPPIGTSVVLGNERAMVVRHHEEGIAVQFIKDQLDDEADTESYARGDDYQR